MSEQTEERLSALLDGELDRDGLRFLLRRLDREPEALDRWSRYCVTRQVLRRAPVVALRPDFRRATMARIEADPQPGRSLRPLLRWASGGAIAASVAVLALTFGNPFTSGGDAGNATIGGDSDLVEAGQGMPASQARSGSGTLVALERGAGPGAAAPQFEFRPPMLAPSQPVAASRSSGLAPMGSQEATLEYDPRLRSYLIRHYQATGAGGQSGFVPYALLVEPAAAARDPARAASAPQH